MSLICLTFSVLVVQTFIEKIMLLYSRTQQAYLLHCTSQKLNLVIYKLQQIEGSHVVKKCQVHSLSFMINDSLWEARCLHREHILRGGFFQVKMCKGENAFRIQYVGEDSICWGGFIMLGRIQYVEGDSICRGGFNM